MREIRKIYRYYTDKRFSTLGGTLVYFLLMSITPFFLWLTLALGNVDVEKFLSHELFNSISPILRYLKDSAESAAGGAGIVLLATSLWSSTNFFYHLRRSGEIVYGSSRVKGGIKLRIASLVLIIIFILLIAVVAGFSVTGTWILDMFLPKLASDAVSILFITTLALAVALVLNVFACPYKLKFSEALTGSLLTTILWSLFVAGFSIYLQFATPERLYGKIASIIVFLLWCYVMMCCFVIGMINNGAYKTRKEYKKLL